MPGIRKQRPTRGDRSRIIVRQLVFEQKKIVKKIWRFYTAYRFMRQNYEDQAACIWVVHDPKHRPLTQPAVTQGSSGKTGS